MRLRLNLAGPTTAPGARVRNSADRRYKSTPPQVTLPPLPALPALPALPRLLATLPERRSRGQGLRSRGTSIVMVEASTGKAIRSPSNVGGEPRRANSGSSLDGDGHV